MCSNEDKKLPEDIHLQSRLHEEFCHIDEFTESLKDDLKKLIEKWEKKYPNWDPSIELLEDLWPEGNTIRIHTQGITRDDVVNIEHEIEKILKRHKQSFETYSLSNTLYDD